jgi:hypothetical protein
VPKNFDDLLSEDLEFVLGGQTFTTHYVRPEVMAAWEDEDDVETAAETLEAADAKIKMFLSADQHEAFDRVRQDEKNPVTSKQLNALIRWLVEVQTGRPSVEASDSQPGAGNTEASSTRRSRSLAAPGRQTGRRR